MTIISGSRSSCSAESGVAVRAMARRSGSRLTMESSSATSKTLEPRSEHCGSKRRSSASVGQSLMSSFFESTRSTICCDSREIVASSASASDFSLISRVSRASVAMSSRWARLSLRRMECTRTKSSPDATSASSTDSPPPRGFSMRACV
eukprot:Amastigsp_a863165_4.p2 type:complete len:149 gc:universal Amastigsp_a863165_4:470-24(-)